MRTYRGRLAPSPTGFFHQGHARTFWMAYERARLNSGVLILRNEDLDGARCRPEFLAAMFEDLTWLGIRWQEGPDVGGTFAPYSQSRRLEHYLSAWRILRDGGYIYPCSCSRKDLAGMASAPHDDNDETVYSGKCRSASGSIAVSAEAVGVNWRFRVPEGEVIEFVDLQQDHQRFVAGKDFGDFLVWRKDGVPSYQLACAVDDAAMQITEVVRGEDLLKSTARQLLIFRALGLNAPDYFHCELIKDKQGQRLAKRHDALSLRALRKQGVMPEQIVQRFIE
jgi:glutamyl/glutaminyl-tRNA synthetase